MAAIQPIQTEYNGYKFRSRLEARWAVFFDEMGLKYQYEHEGYEIAPGVWYLPDFRLADCWVEIKGDRGELNEADRKMGLFVSGLRVPGIVVCGDPLEHTAVLYQPSSDLPCGYVRHLADFCQLKGAVEAARKARQARFGRRG